MSQDQANSDTLPKFLMPERRFSGTLSDNAAFNMSVSFAAAVDACGTLTLRFDSSDAGLEAYVRLHRVFDGERIEWLRLHARAENGTRLSSEHFVLDSLGFNDGPDGLRINFGGHCARAQIVPANRGTSSSSSRRRGICFRLRGLEYLEARVQVTIEGLGNVMLYCPRRLDDTSRDLVTGALLLTPFEEEAAGSAEDAEWCERARRAGEDVLTALSAAAGLQLAPRIVETWPNDGTKETTIYQTTGTPSDRANTPLQAIPDHGLKPFLQAVVRAVAEGTDTLSALRVPLQWLAVPTSQTELRLFCAATAIENLIADGLKGDELCLLPQDEFQRAHHAAKDTLAQALPHLDAETRNRLLPRNDAGLRTKIERLLRKWGAPVDHLPEGALRDAVKARNDIIHRGINSVPAASGRVEVWGHAMVLREVALRLVFARLGYQGPYVSFVGRRHERQFPSCAAPTRDGPAS